jgi:hypothetical protein
VRLSIWKEPCVQACDKVRGGCCDSESECLCYELLPVFVVEGAITAAIRKLCLLLLRGWFTEQVGKAVQGQYSMNMTFPR